MHIPQHPQLLTWPVLLSIDDDDVPPLVAKDVAFNFHNIDRNLQLALPMTINITCTGSSACFSGPAPPAPPPPPRA